MSRKIFDACLPIGEYTTPGGERKKRYKTVGAVMEGPDGGQFLLLDATVLSMQVFALANRDRRDSVLVSLFDANRERHEVPQGAAGDDDIPY